LKAQGFILIEGNPDEFAADLIRKLKVLAEITK
jgi:hypothetical protein